MEPTIQAERLTKRYGAKTAVDEVTFTVHAGEVVGLLGPNGAGKTTLLRMLAGMLAPSAGEARIGGHSAAADPVAARRRLGYLTADTALPPRLTPREVLDLFGAIHELPPRRLAARREEVIQELSLAPFADQACITLSSGQKQRASLARALLHAPAALILDEPTNALDVLSSRFLLDAVRRARSSGRAVLLSTHLLADAELVCDRVLLLHRGRIIAAGAVPEVCAAASARTLTEAFLRLVPREMEEV